MDSATGLDAKPRFVELIAQKISDRKVIVDFFLSLLYLNSVSRLALLSAQNVLLLYVHLLRLSC